MFLSTPSNLPMFSDLVKIYAFIEVSDCFNAAVNDSYGSYAVITWWKVANTTYINRYIQFYPLFYSFYRQQSYYHQHLWLHSCSHQLSFHQIQKTSYNFSHNLRWRTGGQFEDWISLLVKTLVGSGSHHFLFSHSQWNKLVHSTNGNIKKHFKKYSDIYFQNIPGNKNLVDCQTSLDLLLSTKPAILAIGELDHDKLLQLYYPGYDLVPGTQMNPINKKIRVNCLVKVGVVYEVLDLSCEIPTCTLKVDGWTLCFIYREWAKGGDQDTRYIPQQNERWLTFISRWLEIEGKAMVMGDFNYCFLEGNTAYQKQFDTIRHSIVENFLLDGWIQLVQEHTRFQSGSTPSLLDQVYLTHSTYVERVYNFPQIDSDHNLVGVRLRHDGQVHATKIMEKRHLEGMDHDEFERIFKTQNLFEIIEECDVNMAVWKLNVKLLNALNRTAPKKTVTLRKDFAPWIDEEIKADLKIRNDLHKVAQRTGDDEDWRRYKIVRNKLRNKMRRTQDKFNRDWFNADDEKTKWSRITTFTGLNRFKDNGDMEILTNSGMTKSGPVLSGFMNNYFKTKVENLKTRTSPDLQRCLFYTRRYIQKNGTLAQEEFNFKGTDIDTLHRHTKQLSNTSSIGVDDIPTYIVKRFSKIILPYLLHIINLAITKSTYPVLWKTGIIAPIPKKGNMHDPKNWRPIVLNTILSKLLERILNEQLMQFMRRNLIDPITQHAYRTGRSTITALTDVDTFIQKHRNDGKAVALVLTDQSAAFNVLDADILVARLEVLGVGPTARKIIRDYLSGRQTKCRVNGHTSSSITLSSGVGEGSVIGPTLYTLGQVCASMVCDIVQEDLQIERGINVDTLSCEYADDVTGCLAADNDHDLQIGVDKLMDQYRDYFSAAGLCLNEEKCSVLVLRSKKKTLEITMNGKPEEKKVKLLGLWIDSRYEFDDHLNHLIKVISYKISCIRKVAHWLTDDNLKKVVESLVLSHIQYCSEIYLRLKKTRIRVQKLLNAAARLATRSNRYANCEVMMAKLGWLNMHNHYKSQLLCSLRRLLASGSAYFAQQWIDWKSRAGIRTRMIRLSWKAANNHGKLSYLQAAVTTWNSLKVGKYKFEDSKAFKDWTHTEIKRLDGNKNI